MLATFVQILREMPRFFALKVWRWIARVHSAVDVGPPCHAWCPTCNKPWPCREWLSATEQITALRQHYST